MTLKAYGFYQRVCFDSIFVGMLLNYCTYEFVTVRSFLKPQYTNFAMLTTTFDSFKSDAIFIAMLFRVYLKLR